MGRLPIWSIQFKILIWVIILLSFTASYRVSLEYSTSVDCDSCSEQCSVRSALSECAVCTGQDSQVNMLPHVFLSFLPAALSSARLLTRQTSSCYQVGLLQILTWLTTWCSWTGAGRMPPSSTSFLPLRSMKNANNSARWITATFLSWTDKSLGDGRLWGLDLDLGA